MSLTIFTDYKNLTNFIIIKELNRRQIKQLKRLGNYSFKIIYKSEKDNKTAYQLNRKADYMKNKAHFKHSVLKINDDESLLPNQIKLNSTLQIIRDNKEQFPVIINKLKIKNEQIENCIQAHYNPPEYGHPGINKTTRLIRRYYNFA